MLLTSYIITQIFSHTYYPNFQNIPNPEYHCKVGIPIPDAFDGLLAIPYLHEKFQFQTINLKKISYLGNFDPEFKGCVILKSLGHWNFNFWLQTLPLYQGTLVINYFQFFAYSEEIAKI